MAKGEYYVNANPGASVGTIDHAIVTIWNPSATRRIQLLEMSFVFQAAAPAAGAGFVTRRMTTQGTSASNITPTAEHHARREAAPDSGFLLGLGPFSAQPSLAAGELYPQWVFAAVQGSGLVLPIPRGIEIPAGTGLAFVNMAAVIFAASQFGCVVEEL